MENWWIRCFMFSPRVTVTPGFLAQLAVLWLFDSGNVLPLMLLASFLHELGHLAALYAQGGRMRCLSLSACGACIEPEAGHSLSCLGEAVLCLAGPGTNILAAVMCVPLLDRGQDAGLFLGCNLLAGCFNLLPAAPFDGGQALFAVLLKLCQPVAAERVLRISTLMTAVLLGIGGVFLFLFSGYNLTVLFCTVLLVSALARSL